MKSLGAHLPRSLLQRAQWLRDLNQQLLLVLPTDFAGHVQVAGLHRSLLTLEADSPVWASRTRYLGNEITKQLTATAGVPIKSIKLVIRPPSAEHSKSQRKNPYISKQSGQQLESLAASIPYPPLKRALIKLAKHQPK